MFIFNYDYIYYLSIVFAIFIFLLNFTTNFTKYLIGFMISKWFFYRHKVSIFLPLKEVLLLTL